MKVLIKRTTVAGGSVVQAGQVYDLSDADARALILLGKAEAQAQVTTQAVSEVVQEVISEKPILKRASSRKGRK